MAELGELNLGKSFQKPTKASVDLYNRQCLSMDVSLMFAGNRRPKTQPPNNTELFPPCLESLVQELSVRAQTTPTRLAERVLF